MSSVDIENVQNQQSLIRLFLMNFFFEFAFNREATFLSDQFVVLDNYVDVYSMNNFFLIYR